MVTSNSDKIIHLTIDGINVSVNEGATILEAAEAAGVNIPTLCFLKEINEIAACRICLVELKGKETLVAACNTMADEGMEILTKSYKVVSARRTNISLILSQHDNHCVSCVRSRNCALQKLANDLDFTELPFTQKCEVQPWDSSFPLIRDSKKCIKCMRCVQICDKVQGLHVWETVNTGKRTSVNVSDKKTIDTAPCSLCGQCITHCPTGALRERDDVWKLIDAISDPKKTIMVQVAPAVRTAWGESFDLLPEFATAKRLAGALKEAGVDYVFDTNFSADLTIMEEAAEFVARYSAKDKKNASPMPMFTSCCPGWVRFVKAEFPEFLPNLSTAKSPQQMLGAMIKSYSAAKLNIEATDIFSVSIMPCTAKKAERENSSDDGVYDVDLVLTTRELGRFLRAGQINPANCEEAEFDSPMGMGSGAAVIFGTTGGVMEAALRTAHYMITKTNPDPDAFRAVRYDATNKRPYKVIEVNIGAAVIKAAIVSGLQNTRILLEDVKKGALNVDFVEVMACPGGCSGGGGQPIRLSHKVIFEALSHERSKVLRNLDENNTLRFSHENPDIKTAYEEFLEKPLSEISHKLLHTKHTN